MVHVWCSWVSSKVTMCNTSVLNIVVMYVMLHISYMPCSNAIYWKIDSAYSRQIDYTLKQCIRCMKLWADEEVHNTVTSQCSSSLQETPCTYTCMAACRVSYELACETLYICVAWNWNLSQFTHFCTIFKNSWSFLWSLSSLKSSKLWLNQVLIAWMTLGE